MHILEDLSMLPEHMFRAKRQKQKQNKTKRKTDLKMRINPQCKYKKLKKFHVIPDSKILFVIVVVVHSLLCSEQYRMYLLVTSIGLSKSVLFLSH